jgi:hypothetical protein
LASIHIAVKELGIDEDTYRAHLAIYQVNHSNELLSFQADDLLKKYETAGWKKPETKKGKNEKWSKGKGNRKYEELANRGEEWPSPAQLRYIELVWRLCSNVKTDDALQKFLVHKFATADITWVRKSQVQRIIKAIESLADYKNGNK